MIIRILQESDAQLCHELRLRGLRTDPEAFGSTYERESKFTLDTVKERIRPSQDKFTLGAFADDSSLAGIVTFVRESSIKTSHKGNVFGMYVAPEMRGNGIGKLLMNELIKTASNCEGLEQINLSVVSSNESAKRLYKSTGFEVYGVEHNAMKYYGQYSDEDLMVLRL